MSNAIYEQSVYYHKMTPAGKLAVVPTKPLVTQHDLALAYSPGVAEPCKIIEKDPSAAFSLTARGNLVAVISNGTAVLGLGNIGALAAKPVMEGKAVLFKKFAGIDAFDIEINETDPEKLVEIIKALEPTFGGINLEDIKAPECFYIEKKLSELLKIPVFHDDQHGTAIIVAAAIINALELVNKNLDQVKLVVSGAGASAIACLELLTSIGLKKENVIVCDSKGVIHNARTDALDTTKLLYAHETNLRTLEEAIVGADIFLGLSKAGALSQDMVKGMNNNPIILALANPEPEIRPELVKAVRSDAIIATGRSDYPNQVNNVLCFPYIFRGALDAGATTINQAMKIACVHAIAKLAKVECCDSLSSVYGDANLHFGPEYIIPKPFDRRLFIEIAATVAKAAVDSGVATNQKMDFTQYRQQLSETVYQAGSVMRPIFALAKDNSDDRQTRIVFAEGEDERILRTAQAIADDHMGHPVLIGRPEVIHNRIKSFNLRLTKAGDFTIIDPNCDQRYNLYYHTYHKLMARRGVSLNQAKNLLRTNNTIIAALTVYLQHADAMVCGAIGRYIEHFHYVRDIFGIKKGFSRCSTICGIFPDSITMDKGPIFIADPYLNVDPTAEQIVEITLAAAEKIRDFGITPKVALLSHSNFGSSRQESAKKMRQAFNLLSEKAPTLEAEGEMHADVALMPQLREMIINEDHRLKGRANLLIMPNIDAANIAYNLTKTLNGINSLEPILLGLNGAVHIVNHSAKVRSIINMAAIAIADAKLAKQQQI